MKMFYYYMFCKKKFENGECLFFTQNGVTFTIPKISKESVKKKNRELNKIKIEKDMK